MKELHAGNDKAHALGAGEGRKDQGPLTLLKYKLQIPHLHVITFYTFLVSDKKITNKKSKMLGSRVQFLKWGLS